VNLFWAIPANYITCIFVGGLLTGESLAPPFLASQPWILFAALQGLILAVNFYLLAHTAQRVGVAIASLASRLAVAIPSLLAFSLYGDSLTVGKIAGLLTALVALYLCTAPDRRNGAPTSRLLQFSPITLFLTFGCYFTILKYLQTYYLTEASYHSYVMSGFVFAFLSSVLIGLGKRVFTSTDFHRRHLLAGMFLGAINYVAIYALLSVLALEGWESSQLFPIYSVGVVAVSSLLAALIFNEKLSRQKTVGLLVGLAAVALLNR
jgi:drug/metabolite transporter (DMT)-like permease